MCVVDRRRRRCSCSALLSQQTYIYIHKYICMRFGEQVNFIRFWTEAAQQFSWCYFFLFCSLGFVFFSLHYYFVGPLLMMAIFVSAHILSFPFSLQFRTCCRNKYTRNQMHKKILNVTNKWTKKCAIAVAVTMQSKSDAAKKNIYAILKLNILNRWITLYCIYI